MSLVYIVGARRKIFLSIHDFLYYLILFFYHSYIKIAHKFLLESLEIHGLSIIYVDLNLIHQVLS